MRFVALLLFFLSLSSAIVLPNANVEGVIRIPLERKTLTTVTHPGSSVNDAPRDPAIRATTPKGYVDKELVRSHLEGVAMKYHATLAAYESHTGAPHPLAQAISEITTGLWASVRKASGIDIALRTCRLEKWRRRTAAIFDDVIWRNDTSRSFSKRDDIPLSQVNGNMWIGAVSVGTPPQNFTVLFDTGSSDLLLPNQTCGTSCNGHNHYNPIASSTAIDLNTTFQIMYADGSNMNGVQYTDNVYMGGYEALNQTLGAATTYSSQLESSRFRPDGVLGMAFPTISTLQGSPVFQTMLSSGAVQQGVFGFAISSQSGDLTIGGTNKNMYQESTLKFVDVSLPAYWQIRFASLTRPGLNNTPEVIVVNQTAYAEAIIDTGTTLIVTGDSNAQAFYANVPGAKPSDVVGGGAWSVPCDTIDLISPTLTFGTSNFTIPSSAFNLGPVSEGSTDCLAGIAGGGSAYWILGDVFLQSVYTVFDVTNNRIGFADLA